MAKQLKIGMSTQEFGARSEPSTENLNELSTELETMALLCSAVSEIDEDLRALTDALDRSIDELESDTRNLQTEIDHLGEAFGHLTANVAALEETVEEEVDSLQKRQDALESRLDAVEGCLNPDLLEKQTAHVEAQECSIPFDRGDEYDLVVKEVQGTPDGSLRGRLEKVQTFVDVDNPAEYEEGDVVSVIITDLNGTAAHAVPAEVFEG